MLWQNNKGFSYKVRSVIDASMVFYKNNSVAIKRASYTVLLLGLTISIWQFRVPLLNAFFLSLTIGWKIFLLPVIFLIWNFIASFGWLRIIRASSVDSELSLWRLSSIRIQGQALNQVLPMSGIGGETLRSAKIAGSQGIKSSVTTVAIDKMVDVFAELILAVFGLIAFVKKDMFATSPIALAFVCLIFIIALFFLWPSVWSATLRKWPFGIAKDVFSALAGDVKIRNASREAFVLHCVEHALMVVEIYLVSHLLGYSLGLFELLVINAVSSLFSLLFILIPGRIGAFEYSMAFAFNLLALPPSAGVSIALIRRARQVFVCGAGILLIAVPNKKETLNTKACPNYLIG